MNFFTMFNMFEMHLYKSQSWKEVPKKKRKKEK